MLIGKTTYHFKPVDEKNPLSPHVADVRDKEHYKTLMKIDAYQPFDEAGAFDDEKAEAGPSDDQDDDEGDGAEIEEDDDDLDGEPDEGEELDYAEMDEGELIVAYTKVFGRAPHPSAKPETLRDKLISARDQA